MFLPSFTERFTTASIITSQMKKILTLGEIKPKLELIDRIYIDLPNAKNPIDII